MSPIHDLRAQPRVHRWVVLLVLLLAALALLLFVLLRTQNRGDEAASLVLRVVTETGAPVAGAEVFVHLPPGAPPELAGSFSEKTGVLTLPGGGEGRSVLVQAPGHCTERVDDLLEDRTLVLRPGFLARIRVAGDVRPVKAPLRIVFGVQPAPADDGALSEEERAKLVELMALATPFEEGEPDLPPGTVGLVVVDTVAARGLRLPVGGRFAVRWGLFDPQVGAWFTLGKGGLRHISVADDPRPQLFEIRLTQDALDRARAELVRHAESLDERPAR